MYILSIHPDGEYFKVTLLSQKGKKMKIEFMSDLRKDIVDLNQLKRKIDLVTRGREDSIEVISALDPEEVFVRSLELPLRRRRSIMKALPFQLEKLLPFSQEYSTTLPIIKRLQKSSEIILYSFLNETMDDHIQNIKTFGFTPDWVSTVPRGLLRFAKTFAAESENCLMFHLGWARSYLVAISGGEEIFSTPISIGLKDFIDALKDDFRTSDEVSLSLLEVEIERCSKESDSESQMSFVLQEVEKQIYRVIEFLKRNNKLADCKGVIFTGYTETVKKISKWMDAFPGECIDLIPHLEYETKEVAAYALEIGLAIDCLERGSQSVQLRVGAYMPKRLYQKVKKRSKIFIGLSCLTSLLIFATIVSFHVKREVGLKERFSRIVNLSGADMNRFPFLQKTFVRREELKKGIADLVKGLKTVKLEDGLVNEPTLVNETFEWFYPHLTNEITIVNIHYQLSTYPIASDPQKEYAVEYTLRYKAISQESAETFYEKLLESGNGMIQSHSFSIEGNEYKADFTIQNSS